LRTATSCPQPTNEPTPDVGRDVDALSPLPPDATRVRFARTSRGPAGETTAGAHARVQRRSSMVEGALSGYAVMRSLMFGFPVDPATTRNPEQDRPHHGRPPGGWIARGEWHRVIQSFVGQLRRDLLAVGSGRDDTLEQPRSRDRSIGEMLKRQNVRKGRRRTPPRPTHSASHGSDDRATRVRQNPRVREIQFKCPSQSADVPRRSGPTDTLPPNKALIVKPSLEKRGIEEVAI